MPTPSAPCVLPCVDQRACVPTIHSLILHRGAAVKPQFHEWFTRGLVEGQHFLEVPAEPLDTICPALLEAMLSIEGSDAQPAARRLVSASHQQLVHQLHRRAFKA